MLPFLRRFLIQRPPMRRSPVRAVTEARRPSGPRSLVAAAIVVSVASSPLTAVAQESDDGTPTTTTPIENTTETTTTTTIAPTTVPTTTTPTDTVPDTTTTTTTTTVAPAVTQPPTATTTPTTTIAPSTATTTTTVPVVATTTTTTTLPAAPVSTQPTALDLTVFPEQMEHILATIRYQESRGNYTIGRNKGNASGAYQFITSTWNNYGGYRDAYLAPPHIQDERAAKDVQMFLDRYDQDVSMVPIMWYYPIAASRPELMDIVPVPSAGNVLTVREYQTRWLATFATISGQPIAPRLGPVDLSAIAGFAPELPEPHEGVPSLSFPVLGPSRVAVPECDDVEVTEVVAENADAASGPSRADVEAAGLCTEQAPGIVFGVKLQPVVAVADGVVTDVSDEPGSGEPITVTITDPDGTSYVYAGFNDDNPGTDDGKAPEHLRLAGLATVGTVVRAGQVIGFMGDTDPLPIGVRADVPTDSTVQIDPDAVAPHIRISMVDITGAPIDAFGPMIDALFRQTCRVMVGQWSSVANGSGHDEVVIETTDDDDEIDSEWVVTSTGQVLASGWGALVNPTEGCGYAPNTAFGPGGGGSAQGLLHWFQPLDLSTDVWVALSTRDDTDATGLVLR